MSNSTEPWKNINKHKHSDRQDWDINLNFILLAYRFAVQDSTSYTPAVLMLGQEIQRPTENPEEMAFGRPPDEPTVLPRPKYAIRFRIGGMEAANAFAHEQLHKAGIKQEKKL